MVRALDFESLMGISKVCVSLTIGELGHLTHTGSALAGATLTDIALAYYSLAIVVIAS